MTEGRELILGTIGRPRIAATDMPGVYLRAFTALDYAGIQRLNSKAADAKEDVKQRAIAEANAQVLIIALCKQDGTPLFTDADREQLIQLDNAVSQKLIVKISEHCGIDACDLGTAAKNSDATSGGDSPTG